jgi:hypothetical protein
MTSDLTRINAFTRLLAKPVPPELKRGSILRLEGSPERFKLVPLLAAAFQQQRLLEESTAAVNAGDEPAPVTSRWGRNRSIRFEPA